MSKKKSITIYSVFGVILILLTIFSVITFECGEFWEYDFSGFLYNIKKGLDISGGVYAVYEVDEPNLSADELNTRVEGTKKSLENILYQNGFAEAVVSSANNVNDNKVTITVEVPDVEDPERIFDLIGRPAKLEIKTSQDYANGETLILGKKHISKAYVTTNPDKPGEYAVALEFNKEGTKAFAEATKNYLNKQLYFFSSGELMNSGVTVQSQITDGKAIITGGYDYDTAYDFAVSIQAGTFGVNMKLIKNEVISSTLGENAIRNGLIAGGIVLALILIFMVAVYGVFGLLADFALLIYTVLLIVMLSIVPWVQLTLPGIAGIIIGIGMAVDANIIVFERIKDEYRNGKPISTAVHNGFKRATSAVLDGNITTIIGALVLYGLGTSSIKGFAITLIISILLSLFTTLVLSRTFVKMALPFNSTNPKPYRLKREEVALDDEE